MEIFSLVGLHSRGQEPFCSKVGERAQHQAMSPVAWSHSWWFDRRISSRVAGHRPMRCAIRELNFPSFIHSLRL